MGRIRLKQPKYVLPLLLIPFNVFIFYLFRDSFGNRKNEAEDPLTAIEELKTDIPSPNLDRLPQKNKFESFLENFKYSRDFTAMQDIDMREPGDLSEKDQARVDSVNDALVGGERKSFMTQVNERTNTYLPAKSRQTRHKKVESEYEIQMRLFKEQMRYIDSLNSVSAVAESEIEPTTYQTDSARVDLLHVSKKGKSSSMHFNTIRPMSKNHFIQAIIDEDVKVVPGSRVRIRLLDDIYAGDQLIEGGKYLYGTVTSFKPQRIEISITSVLINDQILNVDLKVYDNDGLPGIYVPASQFREFTRDLASNSVSGQNFQFSDTPENQSEMFYNMAERAYSTAARSLGKAAKKNKAKLKYNTILYLVNANKIN